MRKGRQLCRRTLALLLSFLVLATNIGAMPIFALSPDSGAQAQDAGNDGKWHGTTGELVANNYPLNDYEKAILACSGLAGSIYAVEVPTSSTQGLVSVDADAQTVTAAPYETDGFVWRPTAAVLKYTAADGSAGTDITVPLNEVGGKYVGTFQKPANSYRVEVTYSLYIPVDAALQQQLLNTPYYLVDGYIKMDDAANGSLAMAVSAIGEKMAELRTLYNGITYTAEYEGETVYTYTLELPKDSEAKKAIGNLIADYDANGDRLTLAKDFADYMAASSKVQFMMENGAKVKEHITWFYTQLATINANSQDLLDVADRLDYLVTGTGDGTLAGAKDQIDALAIEADGKLDEAIQTEIIALAVDMVEQEYGNINGQEGLSISSLSGKTRKDNAIYNEIEAKRVEFNQLADDLDEMAAFYEMINNVTEAEKARQNAQTLRTTGIEKLNELEAAIRQAYDLGDEKIAELLAKKADVDALGATATQKAADVRDVVTGANGGISLRQVVNTVRNYYNQSWEYLGKALLQDAVSADEYAALDAAVKAAIDPIFGDALVEKHDDIEIVAELFAAETVISAMVDQFVIYVDVKAQVVSKTAENTAATVELDIVSAEFPMDKNTAPADILAAITACGVENAALAQWDSFYNVGAAHYDRTVAIADEEGNPIDVLGALTDDLYYTIIYTPKTYTITEQYLAAGEQQTKVPYGYRWRLPRPADLTKSYDYEIDGESYRENTVVRVVEDITVTRELGKAIAAKTLAELIAASHAPGAGLSAKEKAVLNSNAFRADTVYYRTPDSNDKLTAVTKDGTGYKLVAQTMNAGLLNSDAAWVPVSAAPVTADGNAPSFSLTENGDAYEAYFECADLFTSVQVTYQLQIALDAAQVDTLTNIAYTLTQETAAQKAMLDSLCNNNNFYNNLGEVTSVTLGSVSSVVTNMTPAAKAALNALTSECINANTGNTYLYEYLTQYKSEKGGLAYYYKGDNSTKIRNQIALVNQYLPIVWNDQPVQDYIASMTAMEGVSAKIEAVMAQLAATNLLPVNAAVDTNSANIDVLLAAVTANGAASSHITTGTVVMQTVLSAAAPGQTAYGVEIQVLNKNDGLVQTYKAESFRAEEGVVEPQEFADLYAAAFAQIPNNQYYVAETVLPSENVTLGKDTVTYTSYLRPLAYTVKIDGEANQMLYAFDSYTVTLPGTGNNGLKYIYSIGGSTVEVQSGALENYSLALTIEEMEALFGADRELVITRELVDINKANLLNFINKFNKALANAGFTYAGDNGAARNLALAFIPVEDAAGNLTVVLRVTSNFESLSPTSLASEMMDLIQDISYVGLNGSPLFGLNGDNELKLYVQTMINMIVNSGLGFDSFNNMIAANGDIKELAIAGASVIGAANNAITLANGSVINNVDQLGGRLITSTMQYGVNINNAVSVPFYVTYEDFDAQREMLAKVKKGAAQLLPYVNVSCKDGALNTTLNVPDSVYAYMMAGLLAVGQVDFGTLQSYDFAAVLEYVFGLIDPMFETEGISADTLINTVDQTGFHSAIEGFDLEAHRELMNFLYNSIDHLYDNTGFKGSSVGGLYTGEFTYDALDVLFNSKVMLQDYKSMVAELDTGLTLPITFHLRNREAEYEAMVLDIYAEGITNKYYMSRKASDAVKNVGDGAVVVLLSNVRGNMTFNNDVVLNLNGYTINGDLTAKGTVTIVDSTLATNKCGSVTGAMIADGGTFKLGAGKYLADVQAYLQDGYHFDNNLVYNGCYTMTQNGDDLDIYLDKEYLQLDKSAAKVMATDLVMKLIMNYYGCASLSVDGNSLYALDLLDVTASLNTPSILVNKFINCIDCDDASAFATAFMADVTDFAALADAVDNDEALVSYTLQNAGFNPYVLYNSETDCFSFNVSAADDKKTTNVRVLISNEVSLDQKDKISAILRELDAITTFNTMEVAIQDVAYGAGGLSMEASAIADITVDLTANVSYPVILAAILADGATGTYRTELIAAIKDYQDSYSAAALKTALDNMTVAQLMAALKNTRNKSLTAILKGLGVTAPEAVELESMYTVARKIAGTIVDRSGKTGTGDTLGGLKVAGEYGTYAYRLDKSADTYAALTLRLFNEKKPIIVKDANGIVRENTDDLAAVLKNVKNGDTIYVNGAVALSEDITLPAVAFTLVKTENVDFAGNMLWFADNRTRLTTDADLSAHVYSDSAIFCSAVDYTMDGAWYVFRLKGEAHDWEDIPAVKATCTEPGSTAGVWCKHCHKYQDGMEPEPIPFTGHNYSAVVTPATCTEDGYTTHTCSNCGDIYTDTSVAATNHEGTTETLIGKPATCTEDGLTDGLYCTACGETLKEQTVIEAQHTPKAYEQLPSCTEPGVTGATMCAVCGEPVDAGTVVPATGHGVAVAQGTPATCTDPGLTAGAYCPICDHVHVPQEIIPKLGHQEVIDAAKPASCTETGLTEGSHCDRCHAVLVEQTVIPMAEHTPVVDPAVPPTADNAGWTEGSHCDVCGEVLVPQTALSKLPFIHVPTVAVDAVDGIVRGAKVDVNNKTLFLDANPKGMTAEEFSSVNFKIDNATAYRVTLTDYTGSVVRNSGDLICTGDQVTVWATNGDGAEVSVKYTIIIAGDVNCDGKLNSRDLVQMKMAYVGELALEGPGALAADINLDGKLNSRDTVICETKYVLWSENEYESQVK